MLSSSRLLCKLPKVKSQNEKALLGGYKYMKGKNDSSPLPNHFSKSRPTSASFDNFDHDDKLSLLSAEQSLTMIQLLLLLFSRNVVQKTRKAENPTFQNASSISCLAPILLKNCLARNLKYTYARPDHQTSKNCRYLHLYQQACPTQTMKITGNLKSLHFPIGFKAKTLY